MNNVGSLLSTLYGTSLGVGNASVVGAPSAGVLARVEQAMAPQRFAAARLNASLNLSQARISGLGQLQSALAAFQDIAESLAGAGLGTRATTSSAGVLTVATSATVATGTHAVKVSQLARPQILVGPEVRAADTPLGSGAPSVIRIGSGAASKTVTIDHRNNSLQGIADALKEAGFDASLVRSATGTALQLRSASGAGNELEVSVAGDATLRSLFNGLAETQSAQDAILTVNGKAVRSADNSVESAIAGATLKLADEGETTVTIARDSGQIAKNVEAFAQGFNALQDRLESLGKGALKGHGALGQIRSQLEQLVRSAGGGSVPLANAGVTIDNGRLKLDSEKLQAAIQADPEALAKRFTNEGRGLADALGARLEALGGERGVVSRALAQADREVDVLQSRRSAMAQMLTVQAQALVRLYTAEDQAGGSSSLLDLLA